MEKGIRILALLLGLMMLPLWAWGEETPALETEAPAENVSRAYAAKSDSKSFSRKNLRDNDFDTKMYITADKPLYIDLKECGARYLCIGWETAEANRTVRFYGAADALLLEVEALYPYHDEVLDIPQDTVRLEIATEGEERVGVMEVQLYTEGTLPEPWNFTWEQTPEQLDFLVVSTHFDDDVLFLGAAMPIYGMEMGYTGTVLYMTYQKRLRLDEALRGAWTMGTRHYPLFAMLPDVYKPDSSRAGEFSKNIVTQSLVQYFRQYKPLVIFTQDTKGEYGHWQHIRVVECVLAAAELAADGSYDPESAKAYGAWQVKKVYCHLYPENKLILDTRKPLKNFGGMNAFEIAKEAYERHVSQHGYWFYVSDDNEYSIADYGLAYSAVENPGEEAFDGIDETLFAGYVPPTPAPSPEPTEELTPTPTQTPTSTPTPEPTAVPEDSFATEVPAEETAAPEDGKGGGVIYMGLGLLVLVLLLAALFSGKKKKPGKPHAQDLEDEEEEWEDLEMMMDMDEEEEEDD